MRTRSGILVTATLHTRVETVCSRCLEPAFHDLDIILEEEFFPTVEVYTGAAIHWQEYTDDEAVLMSLPMQPLCSPTCQGLCPRCGANLNEGPHICEVEEIDPRWAALAQFKLEE